VFKEMYVYVCVLFFMGACKSGSKYSGESPGMINGSALKKKELIVAEAFFVDVQLPASKAVMLVVSDAYGLCDAVTQNSLNLPGNIYTAVLFDTKIPKTENPKSGIYSLLWNLSLVELATASDAYAVEGKLGYARLAEQNPDDIERQSSTKGAVQIVQDPSYKEGESIAFTLHTVFENPDHSVSGSVSRARYCPGLRNLFNDPVPACLAL
jgi:hypothetical protein